MRPHRARRTAHGRRTCVGALALVGLVALSGCAGTVSGGTEPRAAQAGPVLLVGDLSAGGSTMLTLDPALLHDLAAAGVRTTAGPGAALVRDVLTLPVTGGRLEVYDKRVSSPYVRGRVEHGRSGLTLTRAGAEVSLGRLVMLPGQSLVTGAVAGVGTDVFVLDGSTLQPLRREDGRPVLDGIRVSLHPAGAALVREALGLSSAQLPDGALLGIAKLTVADPP